MRKKATTDKGLEVVLSFEEEQEVDDLGWVTHQVEAYVGEQSVGYLRMSYIPAEKFEEIYPNPFDMNLKYANKHLRVKYLLRDKPQEDWNVSDYQKAVIDTSPLRFVTTEENERIASLSKEELEKEYEANKQKINRLLKKEYEAFKDLQVDRPFIRYIEVFRGRENHEDPSLPPSRDWRRQGIATLLYEAGAAWMSERRMVLYGSGNPEPAAAATWEKLAQKHEVGEEYTKHYKNGKTPRVYLDGSKINLALEEITPVLDDINIARSLEEAEMPQIESLDIVSGLDRF